VNPSSGGLHPMETYLVCGKLPGFSKPAVYHYSVQHHALETRITLGENSLCDELSECVAPPSHGDYFFVGLSSLHWREVWKYGERGLRYCMLDTGHAIGSLAVSAARLGWRMHLVLGVGSQAIEDMLGISSSNLNEYVREEEREHGMALILVTQGTSTISLKGIADISGKVVSDRVVGIPNIFTTEGNVKWEIVEVANLALTQNNFNKDDFHIGKTNAKNQIPEDVLKLTSSSSINEVIRLRRSALDFNGKPIESSQFFHIMWALTHALPVFPWPSVVNLFIFVYNVKGLKSGYYALVRNQGEFDVLRNSILGEFSWESLHELPLYLLKEAPAAEVGELSFQSSCHQSIASHESGAFSLGMFANLGKIMDDMGPIGYAYAHYECGFIGQLLYLEAHALGINATGIGCFLDDLSREAFGLQNSPFQPLYHFAIGREVPDNRYTYFDYSNDMLDGTLDECVNSST